MKDFYYILGVDKEADLKDIQLAYRKLSLKFNQTDRQKDEFYTLYFRNISEAYQTLSDEHKRYRYDIKWEKYNAISSTSSNFPLRIHQFISSKNIGKPTDLFTLSWNIQNADEVHLSSIGPVNAFDTRSVRVPEDQKELAFFTFTIMASQHSSEETQEKHIQIKNSEFKDPSYSQIDRDIPTLVSKQKKKIPHSSDSLEPPKRFQLSAYLIAATMFILILIFIYILHSINPII